MRIPKALTGLVAAAMLLVVPSDAAVNVTLNGVTYSIPEPGDTAWGQSLTDYLIATGSGLLQKSGGAFTLTSEVDFGATYGLKSAYYKSHTANIASAGALRLANADTISWRNAGNSADLPLGVDGSNNCSYNSHAFLSSAGILLSGSVPALTGDVTTSAGNPATTVAKIQGTTVSGVTGTGNVVFSASPTLTGTATVPTVAAPNGASSVAGTSLVLEAGAGNGGTRGATSSSPNAWLTLGASDATGSAQSTTVSGGNGGSGTGGGVTVQAGQGRSSANNGASLTLSGGSFSLAGGGSAALSAGNGTSGANGGVLTLSGGSGNSGGTTGASIALNGGDTATNGGELDITVGASAGTNSAGQNLLLISGKSTGNAAGGSIQFYTAKAGTSGSSLNSASVVGSIDSNGAWTLGASGQTPFHALNTATAANASGSGSLTNLPSGKSGNPAGYINININGASRVIPYW